MNTLHSTFALLLTGLWLIPAGLAEDGAPLRIRLPDAFEGGTAAPYFGTHFEPYDYKERPPFLAPEGTAIVSLGKPVTSSIPPIAGTLDRVTDGAKSYRKTDLVELPEGLQWVQVDLEEQKAIYAILVWHFHEGRRVYFDVIGQVSDDPKFEASVTTVFNNDYDDSAGMGEGKDKEYEDSHKGLLVDTKGVKGRYVRFYSHGNTANEFNHYVEIEVWGSKE